MRILVTGKNGQLGKSIQSIVNTQCGIDYIPPGSEFVFVGREELDFTDNQAIIRFFDEMEVDFIVNCAAYTAVDKAEQETTLANQINHLAVKQLAKIAHDQNVGLIHISTDYVFDGSSSQQYSETSLTNPINNYGKTKLAGEQAIQEIMPTNAIILRTSWVYSEYGHNFVETMLRIGKEQDELKVVSDQIGMPTYAADLAKVILAIITNKSYQNKECSTEIFHYSNQGSISWFEFAKEIFNIAQMNCNVSPVTTAQYPTLAKRPKNSTMSNDKIKSYYQIDSVPWKESLGKFIQNYNDRA
tara:strand:+ start:3103 stop:4002 length:900 start_codon:yes stop_codon:yes gene_type:complete